MEKLLTEIANCRQCIDHLPLGPRPVCVIHPESKILIVGQAPGLKVHESGIPWDDQSGRNLRMWLNVDADTFYEASNFAIVPMGFCYPGRGKQGDLPPRKECAPLWHESVILMMPQIELTLLIGKYAQDYYLGSGRKSNLTETVKAYEFYLPKLLPLPHPSPRNNIWQRKNPWFQEELLPKVRSIVHAILHPIR